MQSPAGSRVTKCDEALRWNGKHVAGLSHRPDFQVRVCEASNGRRVVVAGLERERNPSTPAAFAPDRGPARRDRGRNRDYDDLNAWLQGRGSEGD